jgi:hypothetical protein
MKAIPSAETTELHGVTAQKTAVRISNARILMIFLHRQIACFHSLMELSPS